MIQVPINSDTFGDLGITISPHTVTMNSNTILKPCNIVNTIPIFFGSKDRTNFRDLVLGCADAKDMLPQNVESDFVHLIKIRLRDEALQFVSYGKSETINDLIELLKNIYTLKQSSSLTVYIWTIIIQLQV